MLSKSFKNHINNLNLVNLCITTI